LEAHNQPGAKQLSVLVEARRHPRFRLQTDIRVYSRSAGLLTGYTVDISESGISAMLKLELSVGELVQLEFDFPLGPVAIRALVRHKTAFCYGFQFVEPDLQGVIKATCSRLAALQSDSQDSAQDR
jgi:PilZ domain